MTDTNQKLREALQVAEAALSDIGDADREPGDDLAWCERRAAQSLPLIRQALALPTATPVGERELFERTMMDKYGWQHEDFKLDDFGYADGQTDTAWMAWQARASLSAGDAVDAQRTPLTVLQYNAIPELCAIPPSLYESVVRAIERAHGIDAAMRKAIP